MQRFLDQERVLINGKQTYPKVVAVDVGFKGDPSRPYIRFFILFLGELRKGLNIYEDYYEPEVAEYDYDVYWIYPLRARVVKAELGVPYRLLHDGRVLSFSVSKGTRVGGYERVEFELL